MVCFISFWCMRVDGSYPYLSLSLKSLQLKKLKLLIVSSFIQQVHEECIVIHLLVTDYDTPLPGPAPNNPLFFFLFVFQCASYTRHFIVRLSFTNCKRKIIEKKREKKGFLTVLFQPCFPVNASTQNCQLLLLVSVSPALYVLLLCEFGYLGDLVMAIYDLFPNNI